MRKRRHDVNDVWVNYGDLTVTLESCLGRGIIPIYHDISLFQVSELFRFAQNDIPNIPGYDVTIFSDPSDGFVDQYPNVGEDWCLWFLSLWRLNPKQCLFHIQVHLLIFSYSSYSHIFPLFHIPAKRKTYELIWSMFIYVFSGQENVRQKHTVST